LQPLQGQAFDVDGARLKAQQRGILDRGKPPALDVAGHPSRVPLPRAIQRILVFLGVLGVLGVSIS
jgi:hypothetical protein